MFTFERGNRTRDAGGNHRHLEAVGVCEFELRDRLLRCMHRDRRGRRETIAKRRADFRIHRVERAHRAAAHVAIVNGRQREAQGRVHDREVDADFVEPLMKQLRRHHRREVVRIVADAPPCAAHVAGLAVAAGAGRMLPQLALVSIGEVLAAGLLQIVLEQRRGLDQVAVAIDDRMIEFRAKRLDACGNFARHGGTPLRADDC